METRDLKNIEEQVTSLAFDKKLTCKTLKKIYSEQNIFVNVTFSDEDFNYLHHVNMYGSYTDPDFFFHARNTGIYEHADGIEIPEGLYLNIRLRSDFKIQDDGYVEINLCTFVQRIP